MQDRGRPRGLLLSEKLNFRRGRSLLFVLLVLGASSCVLRSAGADDFDDAHPAACAYLAVLAHLEGDALGEERWRIRALAHWPTNPEVDHTIGRKLSQK